MKIDPYKLDAFAHRDGRGKFAVARLYVPVLQGDGVTMELRKRFARKSHAEAWAIRARARLMVRYDAMAKGRTG